MKITADDIKKTAFWLDHKFNHVRQLYLKIPRFFRSRIAALDREFRPIFWSEVSENNERLEVSEAFPTA
jgi:hypothetical protein